MSSNNLTDDIKHTGWALRDWLGPYYTLGCAVAFGIALLTLLDPSGQLVRAVGAVLLVLTILAWVYHFYRQHQDKAQGAAAAGPKVKLHGILLAVTLFFLCGIVISDAVMRGKRPGAAQTAQPYEEVLESSEHSSEAAAPAAPTAPVAAAVQPAPTTSAAQPTTPPAATEVAAPAAQASTAQAPAAVVPAVAPASATAPASPIVTMAPAPASTEPRVLPARIDVLPDSPNSMARAVPVSSKNEPLHADARTSHAERNSERSAERSSEPSAAPRAAPPVNRQRCSSLLGKFSLGEELNAEDKRFLETSCR